MDGRVAVEDFSFSDGEHVGRKPPHHLPPTTPTRLIRDSATSEGSRCSNACDDVIVEDFVLDADIADPEGSLVSTGPKLARNEGSLPENEMGSLQRATSETFGMKFVIPDCSFQIAHDCKLVDQTNRLSLCPDFIFDNEQAKFCDFAKYAELVNVTVKVDTDRGMDIVDENPYYNIPKDFNFETGHADCRISEGMELVADKPLFSVPESVDGIISGNGTFTGGNGCSFDPNKPTFSIPSSKQADVKNTARFSIPSHPRLQFTRSSTTFSAPESFSGFDSRHLNVKDFHLAKDIRTYRTTSHFHIPEGLAFGEGSKVVSIPMYPEGDLKQNNTFSCPEGASYKEYKSKYSIAKDQDQSSEVGREHTFNLSEDPDYVPGKPVYHMSRQQSGTFEPAYVSDFSGSCSLVNRVRAVSIPSDCSLCNKFNFHFKELEISSSIVSIDTE